MRLCGDALTQYVISKYKDMEQRRGFPDSPILVQHDVHLPQNAAGPPRAWRQARNWDWAETLIYLRPYCQTDPFSGAYMLRPVLPLAALGAAGILAWQLLWGLVLPLVVGILAIAIKIAFWVAL